MKLAMPLEELFGWVSRENVHGNSFKDGTLHVPQKSCNHRPRVAEVLFFARCFFPCGPRAAAWLDATPLSSRVLSLWQKVTAQKLQLQGAVVDISAAA